MTAAMELAELDVRMEAIYGRPVFFSRAGRPITFSEHAELTTDRSYVQLELTRVGRINRRRWTRCKISTVWHGFDTEPKHVQPIIFETLIIGGPLDGDQWVYLSEEDAFKGHAQRRRDLTLKIQEKIHEGRKARIYREPKPKPRYKYRTHGQRRRG